MSDKMKPSRLELRLEGEISAALSVLEADCKRAELAADLVRLGRVAEVELTLQDLHQRYKAHPNVAVSALRRSTKRRKPSILERASNASSNRPAR